jgi:hypothetical protein
MRIPTELISSVVLVAFVLSACEPSLDDHLDKLGLGGEAAEEAKNDLILAKELPVDALDRAQLERLCRYVMRPPLAAGRLQILDDEQVAFSLKSVWSDGTYQIVLAPEELLEKLAALVPPPLRMREPRATSNSPTARALASTGISLGVYW